MNIRNIRIVDNYEIYEGLNLFNQRLDGKSVVIIGGAANPDNYSAFYWQNFDFRIGINNHLVYHPQVKVDALFTTEKPQVYKVSQLEDAIIFKDWDLYEGKEPEIPFSSAITRDPECIDPCLEWGGILARQMQTRPLTGMIALDRVCASHCKSIHLIGFDFYCNEDLKIPYKVGSHLIENNFNWLLWKLETDIRIRVDDRLMKVIEANTECREIEIPEAVRVFERDGKTWRA